MHDKNHILKKYQSWFIWLIFLFLSVLVFGRTLNDYFLSDDWHWLYLGFFRPVDGQVFLTNYAGDISGGSYNPFLFLLYKFFVPIFGTKYFWYHAVSIVLHATNAWLVYKLAKRFVNKSAIACGLLFLFWPVQVEVVAWIAAWPHLWATFFGLLTLLFYRSKPVLALLFFILAIFTKEIAIILPFIILLWEAYDYSIKKQKINIQVLLYFIILIAFIILRYLSTKILFGFYGQDSLGFAFRAWIGNLAGLANDYLSFGFLRNIFYKVWYYHLDSVAIMVLVFLAGLFYFYFKKKKTFQFVLLFSFLLATGLILPLGLHRTTFAGERYLYFPSIFLVIFLVYLLRKIKPIFWLVILLIFAAIIQYKLGIWDSAGKLSRQIVESYQDLNLAPGVKLVSVGLPDNLSGAEVFRNNLQQALEIVYPKNHPDILPLPIYVFLNPENKNEHLLKWRQDSRGWFAESVDGGQIVTGKTSITIDGIYFELWNYNYQNFTANLIRLIPDRDIRILTFDQGVLKIIE